MLRGCVGSVAVLALATSGCILDAERLRAGRNAPDDAGLDAAPPGPDAGVDGGGSGPVDAGTPDAWEPGPVDAGTPDAWEPGPVDAGPPDAWEPPPCNDTAVGPTEYYVVSAIRIPTMPDASGAAPGYDLDGVDTTTPDPLADRTTAACTSISQDYVSVTDPTEMGVDNQLAGALGQLLGDLVPGGLDGEVQGAINEGTLLLVMRVDDLDDVVDDCSVSVSLFLSTVPGGGAPMLTGDRLTPGQTFDMGQSLGAAHEGSITAGRLRVAAPELRLPLSLEIRGTALTLTLSDATVEGDITADAMMNGNIGASITIPDFVASFDQLGFGAVVVGLVGRVADLAFQENFVVTVGGSDMMLTGCSAISAGLAFDAVDVAGLN